MGEGKTGKVRIRILFPRDGDHDRGSCDTNSKRRRIRVKTFLREMT